MVLPFGEVPRPELRGVPVPSVFFLGSGLCMADPFRCGV